MGSGILTLLYPDKEKVRDAQARRNAGRLAGMIGIAVNLLLFAGKFVIGLITGLVSIRADAYNNLSDAGSSLISCLSFFLSARRADRKHPFGHARYEYLAGLTIGIIIILLGHSLVVSSFHRIKAPVIREFSFIGSAVLLLSILGKGGLFLLYRRVGRRIDSQVLAAGALDSVSDMLTTLAVLVSSVLSPLIHVDLDGYIGMAVAAFVTWSGIRVVRDAGNSLLGQPASDELINAVKEIVNRYPAVIGMHDLVCHDYGPGHCFITMHCEVPASESLTRSHDIADTIERVLAQELSCTAVIHMDPVDTGDIETQKLKAFAESTLRRILPALSLHDFRTEHFSSHTNCIFDVNVPFDSGKTDAEIAREIGDLFAARGQNLFPIIHIDHT